MYKRLLIIVLSAATLMLSACDKAEKREGVGRYGMMESGTPEYTAIEFFDHVYHDESMEDVLRISSPKMARLIRNYKTNRNFQRHVLNLTYEKVEMMVDSGNNRMRSEFADKASVVIFFTGTDHGDKKEDLRTVNLIKIGGDWKIDEIEVDKFM